MSRDWIIDLLGNSALLFWLGGSVYFAASGDAALFGRFGAVGTAAAVGYFALVGHAKSYPPGLRQHLKMATDQSNFLSRSVQDLFKSRTFMAFELVPIFNAIGRETPPFLAGLAKPELVKHAAESPNFPLEEWETKNADLTENCVAADDEADRIKTRSTYFQAWIVVVATLQWGFGDLLISRCFGNGS